MKVIICGAGQVGSNIARQLAGEGNDVTVIDQSPALIQKISESLDIKALEGFASHPTVLERAGAEDADMIIAVTFADEVNMIACQVAHSIFNVPTKVARIRHQSYLQPIWRDLFSRDHLPIDVIISPEIEVARAITRLLQVPGAIDMIPFADGRLHLVAVRCEETCPIINTPLRQLTEIFPELSIVVVAIVRGDRPIVPTSDDQMLPGDEVYFVAEASHVGRAMRAFGHEESEARRIVIAGAGNIGLFLGHQLTEQHPGVSLKFVELDMAHAERAAQELPNAIVLQGDVLDPEILAEANIAATEAIVAVTNEDEVNVLGSLLAKRHGCRRALTLVNNMGYAPLIASLGVDAVINPRETTVSSILQHVRRGRVFAAHSLGNGFAEAIEVEALETSPLVGRPLREAKLPSGVIVAAVVREDEVIIARADTIIRPRDRVLVLAAAQAVKKVEKMFSVSLEYF